MDSLPDQTRWLLAAPIYAIAYAVALAVFAWTARRRGIATSGIWLLMQAGLFGGLLGANVVQFVATGLPGKTIEGGFVGGYLAVVLMKRHLRIARPTGDLFALAMSAGEAIGRIACFVGGCCYGKVSGAMLAAHDHGAFRYATQLYLSFAAAATSGLLVWLERRRALPENGLLYVQGMLFCASRFAIEFYRAGPTTSLGLTTAQIGCAVGLAFFTWKFATLMNGSRRERLALTPAHAPA